MCLNSIAGASKPAVQDVPPSAATASVAASPAATAPAAESTAAAVPSRRSQRRPAAPSEQQAGDMTIATFECGSRTGSWCFESSAFEGSKVARPGARPLPRSSLQVSVLCCRGPAADSGSTRGFRPSVSHARFLCQCFDEKGPRLFDFPGQARATTIRRSLLHGPRVFAGGVPPVNCRSSFSNRGKRFWIDMFGNGFFSAPLVARWFGRDVGLF